MRGGVETAIPVDSESLAGRVQNVILLVHDLTDSRISLEARRYPLAEIDEDGVRRWFRPPWSMLLIPIDLLKLAGVVVPADRHGYRLDVLGTDGVGQKAACAKRPQQAIERPRLVRRGRLDVHCVAAEVCLFR